jgi:hypothetical protein
VRGEECAQLLTEFFRQLRKKKASRKEAKSGES